MQINTYSKSNFKILIRILKAFSKRYKTLCSTDAVKPEFKLMPNFPI